LAAELLKDFEPEIEQVSLVPSEGGRFEIEVNGVLIYSKQKLGRHAQPGEVKGLVRNYLKEISK
jgi:selenoprotein W-related protein